MSLRFKRKAIITLILKAGHVRVFDPILEGFLGHTCEANMIRAATIKFSDSKGCRLRSHPLIPFLQSPLLQPPHPGVPVCRIPPPLPHRCRVGREPGARSRIRQYLYRLRLLVLNYSRTRTQPPVPVPEWTGVCEIRNAGKDLTIPTSRGGNQDRTPQRHPLSGITGCNAWTHVATFHPPRIDTDIVLQTGVASACERNPIPRLCEMHT